MCARLISRLNAAIDFASFDLGQLETLEKVRGRIGFSILRPTLDTLPISSCPIQILSRKIYHAASDCKKFSIHFYFNNNKLSTFQNSRINRKKSDSKICLFNFRLLRKEKNLKLSYRQTSIRRGKPSRRKTERKI